MGRLRVGEGGAVGSGVLGVGGGALEFPSLPVDEGVVVPAEKDQVVEVGGAVVLPPGLDVVGVAPGGGAAAAGEPAMPIPQPQRPPLRRT